MKKIWSKSIFKSVVKVKLGSASHTTTGIYTKKIMTKAIDLLNIETDIDKITNTNTCKFVETVYNSDKRKFFIKK